MTRPYIIAELSGNHNGDLGRALALMEAVKAAGADAVKLQTYTADTMTIDCDREDFIIKGGPWDGYKLYDLYQKAHTPWQWHEALFKKARELGIDIFSTPFDETAVDFLESLGNPIYKIASFEITHHPLIAYVARLKKPIIMSTGMASLEEIEEAVGVAFSSGCEDLTLLHCVSAYPAAIEDCHLLTMVDLKKRFPQCKVGLSDHTLGITVPIAATALGARVIEKHVTLKRSDGGVDSTFSLEPHELRDLCRSTKEASCALGKPHYKRSAAEHHNRMFRRSVYAVQDIQMGEVFSHQNVRIIRPGFGAAPKNKEHILGEKAPRAHAKGDRISDPAKG